MAYQLAYCVEAAGAAIHNTPDSRLQTRLVVALLLVVVEKDWQGRLRSLLAVGAVPCACDCLRPLVVVSSCEFTVGRVGDLKLGQKV